MPERETPYIVVSDQEASDEINAIHVFHRRQIVDAIRALEFLAETETRNRKCLAAPLDLLPDASWECRVGRFRVLYRVEGRKVRVLRVILKVGTTRESL